MHLTLEHDFAFRPVGQGLFAHGTLDWDSPNGEGIFNWLYDCGTSSSYALLQDQIDQYIEGRPSERIHLATLSHYDQDHVCGLADLIRKRRIDTLVLPYVYPAQRLIWATQAEGRAREYQRFLTDPASYLLGINPENLGRVVFVTPGGESPPPPEGDNPNPDRPWPRRLHRENEAGSSSKSNDGFSPSGDPDLRNSPKAQLVASDEPLGIAGAWEFCFYNRKQPVEALQAWWADAQPVWDDFQSGKKAAADYDDLIDGMRRSFARHRRLPKTHFTPNEISLFMYEGPMLGRRQDSDHWHGAFAAGDGRLVRAWSFRSFEYPAFSGSGSQLFSGDITMTAEMATEIETFLGPQRWTDLTYFQVPHHGASRSWRAGVYDNWPHRFSVFSAQGDGGRFGHPHEVVVDALTDHGPVFVNGEQGFEGHARFEFR